MFSTLGEMMSIDLWKVFLHFLDSLLKENVDLKEGERNDEKVFQFLYHFRTIKRMPMLLFAMTEEGRAEHTHMKEVS